MTRDARRHTLRLRREPSDHGQHGRVTWIPRIANQPLVRCEDGSLEVEGALFLVAPGPRVTTSAGEARGRLARAGLTPALAKQALEALSPEALASYARADCVRAVLPKLGPCEVFAGRTFNRTARAYDGTSFDLRALVADVGVESAAFVLQGLHLVSVLDELAPGTVVELDNGSAGSVGRTALLKAQSVISALQAGPREARTRRGDDDAARAELARSLRDRAATATATARSRQRAIEHALAEIDRPTRGRLADTELWTIERQLGASDTRGALERIEDYVELHGGETAATRYLRAHLALIEESEPPRRIAEGLFQEGGPSHRSSSSSFSRRARGWRRGFGRTRITLRARSWTIPTCPTLYRSPRSRSWRPPTHAASERSPLDTLVGRRPAVHRAGAPLLTATNAPSSPPRDDTRPPASDEPHLHSRRPADEPAPSSLNLPMDFEDPISEPEPISEAPNTQVDDDPHPDRHFEPLRGRVESIRSGLWSLRERPAERPRRGAGV